MSDTTASPRNATILIVDDNPTNLGVIFDTLREQGFRTLVATDGELALQRAEQSRPDLILLDVVMPGIDGFETCRRLKANDITADIPVIFITSLAKDDSVDGFQAGGVDYITKPIRSGDVLARVTTHLRIRQLARELQQANHSLTNVNAEFKNFAYSVSHDLKAPLRGIARLATWFAEDYADRVDEEGQEMLALLKNRVKHMESLIDGILKYSRAGRVITEYEQIPLHPLVQGIIELLNPPDTMQVVIEGTLPEVSGDSVRLSQVFQNLIGNAITFMDKPKGLIRIAAQDDGEFWRFSVADNGPGIAPNQHERIFAIFQTISSTNEASSTEDALSTDTASTDVEVKSSGIGLSLVKRIVELHRGSVWVESVPGEGSTFCFTLPKNAGTSHPLP